MNSRRKQLIEQYKQMKPDMGVFWIRSKVSNQYFIEASQNLKGKMNSTKFQLDAGAHPNQELQNEWRKLGAEQFNIEILEQLKYEKDESKTDYTEELEILKFVWEEKLNDQKLVLFKKGRRGWDKTD